jgi:tetratricopeptide (TPR) repeat protein
VLNKPICVKLLFIGLLVGTAIAATSSSNAVATEVKPQPDLVKDLANTEPPPEDNDLNRLTVAALKQASDGQYLTAAAWNQAILNHNPDNPIVLFNLGNCYLRLVQTYPEALKLAQSSFEKAWTLRPDFWEAGLNLAVTQQRQGDFEEAEKTYKSLLTQSPNNPTIRINLAIIEAASERYEDALSTLTPAGKDVRAARLSAIIFMRIGKFDAARQAWKRVLILEPKGDSATIAKDRLKRLKGGETQGFPELDSDLFQLETTKEGEETH